MKAWIKGLATGAVLWSIAGAVWADGFSGAYLAARQAELRNDFPAASRYFSRALMLDPGNAEVMEALALTTLLQGDFDRAVPVAKTIEAAGQRSQVAHMLLLADDAMAGAFKPMLERGASGLRGIGPLVDGLVAGWAHLGAGERLSAMAAFDTLAAQQGMAGFAYYHKALALAQQGDFEAAEAIFAGDANAAVQLTRRGAMARAEILSQMGRNADALEMLDAAFGPSSDPGLRALREALSAGETLPFNHVRNAVDGLAEVFYSIAAALAGEAPADYALLYSRIAEALRSDHTDAILLSADYLDDLGQQELAIRAFARVPSGHVDYHAAEIGRAGALRAVEKYDAAIEVLKNLTQDYEDLPSTYSTLGDIYRQTERFEEAAEAYTEALARTQDPDGQGVWFLHYARAIAFERQGKWDQAEADFRRALELRPNQPQVLNYLGYSLVEKQIKLDEALDMIERAVAGRPDSGYIVDSLGWVLYRLGRYDEAVGQMERAVELMPVDPVVNDHLGDVYWAVGRVREAEFQWSRALSLIDPIKGHPEAKPERIRRKLDVGLDQVLSEEGADPLKVANDD